MNQNKININKPLNRRYVAIKYTHCYKLLAYDLTLKIKNNENTN